MTQDAVASSRQTCSSSQLIPPEPSDPQPISGRAICQDALEVETGPWKEVSRCLGPHWDKVQYLFPVNSNTFHIICSDRSLSTEKKFESSDLGVFSEGAELPSSPFPLYTTAIKIVKILKARINSGQKERHCAQGNSLQRKRRRLGAAALILGPGPNPAH